MTVLDRIAAVMGCTPEDDDDLIEAVRLLVAERDAAVAQRDALAGASRRYIAAADAFMADACAGEPEHAAALRALNAALAAAGGGA